MDRARFWISTGATLAVLFAADRADAGGCTTCQSNADCQIVSPDAVCVRHDGDVGCGADRQLCCPGQACALNQGVPSCLGTTCTLVESQDAGPSDAAQGDAAAPGDAAVPDTGAPDSGSSTTSTTPVGPRRPGTARDRPGGCACDIVSAESAAPWILVFGIAALLRRRRRA